MRPRIAILTPDPADEGYRTRWREVLTGKAAPLERAGMIVEGRSWAEPDGLAGFDLVMPLLAWGYHRAGRQWRDAVDGWEARGVRVQNPPSVLRWNADKAYLGRLAGRGAPVVPTRYVERLTEAALREAAAAFGTDRLIAKPRISASAWQTIRWAPGTHLDGGPTGPAMIQPYLSSIESEGEISLIFFGGAFSHAIDKRPGPGDFRVQPEHGATIRPHPAAADELATAAAILAHVDEALLYARIDLVRGRDGGPLLMELELVEPDLYLEHGPDSGAAFAAAVGRAARS
jgi:glutathione synthase/RimK-type ligase-like ATP-grasp enzyme